LGHPFRVQRASTAQQGEIPGLYQIGTMAGEISQERGFQEGSAMAPDTEAKWTAVAASLGLATPCLKCCSDPERFEKWAMQVSLVHEIEGRNLTLQGERDKANRLARCGMEDAR
jgi:hypothetical protein